MDGALSSKAANVGGAFSPRSALYSGPESLDERMKMTPLPTSSCIKCDSGDECTPFWTKTAVIEQDSWALFEPHIAAVTVANPAPVHVRDNMIEGDIILTHQPGRELRGALDRSGNIVAPVHTHFDPDGRPVSRAFVISMLSGFVGRQALVNRMIVHREMPGEKSSAIVAAPEPVLHGERIVQRVGAARRIVGRMNRDKCRTHRPMQRASAFPWGDDVLCDFQFGCAGGRQAAQWQQLQGKEKWSCSCALRPGKFHSIWCASTIKSSRIFFSAPGQKARAALIPMAETICAGLRFNTRPVAGRALFIGQKFFDGVGVQ